MDVTGLTTHRRGLLFAAGAVAIAVAVAVTAGILIKSPHPRPQRTPAAPVIAAPTPAKPTTVLPVARPRPARKPAVPHEFVRRSVPTVFTLRGRGFTIRAHVCAMPPVFPLDPPGEQHHTVCWVTRGFGFKPGSHSGTSYILGHAWAEDPLEVLNKESERATRQVLREKPRRMEGVPVYPARNLDGSTITLRTPTGRLVYTVRDAFGVSKDQLGNIHSIMDQHVRNRVVLITCAELHGVDYHYNIVLDARLSASRSREVTGLNP